MLKKNIFDSILIKQDDSIESNHIGLVTSSTLIELNALNHAWIRISLQTLGNHNNHNEVSVKRKFEEYDKLKAAYVVQLYATDCYDYTKLIDFEDSFDDETENCKPLKTLLDGIVYVSSSAFFNIMVRDVDLYMRYRSKEIKVDVTILHELNSLKRDDYSTYVDLSLVSCPFGSFDVENIDNILQTYFEEPKLISLNEIFNIPMRHVGLNTPRYLWFKVKACNSTDEKEKNCFTNSMFVSSDYSKLVLSAPVQAYVPLCPCTYQNNIKLLSLFSNENFKNCFEKSKAQICNLIAMLNLKVNKSSNTLVLLEGNHGVGKGLMIRSICEEYCIHFLEENCYDLFGESMTATEKRLEKLFETFTSVGPCILYLKHVEMLCKDREGSHEERRIMHSFIEQVSKLPNDYPLVVVGGCISTKDLTRRFHSEFIYHIKLDSPVESDRLSLIKALSTGFNINDELISSLVQKSSGFVLADFIALFTKINNISCECGNETERFGRSSITVTVDVADAAFEELRKMKAGSGSVVHIPKVNWADVGGLQSVKNDILDTIELPLKFPNLFSSNLQRSGLLFYGPPGCGKTLLAKAIATEFTLNFYSVKGPELIDMYVGQSEENVRNVFLKARTMAPCIIFFDELDSIAPNRGRSGDSGGVMDRIVSQLLSELDGIHNNIDIFIIGATNRPDLLDPALLRPGRFDKVIYVGVPEDRDERLRIFNAVTRKLMFSEDVNLDSIIEKCPPNLTGADFSALASECLMNCYRRLIQEHQNRGGELNPDKVYVSIDDIHLALKSLVPSVSLEELERYKKIREQFLISK